LKELEMLLAAVGSRVDAAVTALRIILSVV